MINQDQEIFNVLLETVSDAVLIVNDKQTIVEVNGVAETVFGYGKSEIKGKHLNLLLPSNYHNKHDDYFDAFIKAPNHQNMAENREVYGLKKNGDIIPIKVDLNPFKIYNKSYVIALVKDISKQKETEFDFMLRTKALESASNGIIITDARQTDNPIIYFNSAFESFELFLEIHFFNIKVRYSTHSGIASTKLRDLYLYIKFPPASPLTSFW